MRSVGLLLFALCACASDDETFEARPEAPTLEALDCPAWLERESVCEMKRVTTREAVGMVRAGTPPSRLRFATEAGGQATDRQAFDIVADAEGRAVVTAYLNRLADDAGEITRLTTCPSLITLRVSDLNGNTSYAGACRTLQDRSVMVCGDEFLGRFVSRETEEEALDTLAAFAVQHCYGG